MQNVYFERWGQKEIAANIDAIKDLRKIYAHFPYLYEYDEAEEINYLNAYLEAGDDLDAFVCLSDNKAIGISIGCKLITTIPICEGFNDLNVDTKNAYYFGDIIVDPKAWGLGIADKLYEQHIAFVQKKGFKNILALLVQRDINDPRKPKNYRPSELWAKHGFFPTNQTTQFAWKTKSFTDKPASKETHDLRVYEKTL